MKNPFLLYGYKDPNLFCDRELEVSKLNNAINNGRNITLISLRRLGKTGLIKHLFHHLEQDKSAIETLYIDIMPTNNLGDMVKEISSVLILQEQKKSKRFLQNMSDLISGLKAKLLFNPISGSPELEFGYKSESESLNDLNTLFSYIGNLKKPYVIAIDEFQQINNYPEKQVEAWFRKFSQEYPDIRFIFSGSSKHILEAMFTNINRPFYQSSELLYLDRINTDNYTEFIHHHFTVNKKSIKIDDIKEWVKILDTYTFYVQYFFNKLFAQNKKNNTYKMMYEVSHEVLKERENIFINYKNLLTNNQFQLIKAIGKEEAVNKPNAHHFIKKHNLPAASSINTALNALLEKQMVYHENGQYKVYDHFFSMWLRSL
ncbi:AAA family ATPase [Carboxylicivirga sp. N1Y90]|uniref:AAA family ATPase n=1 Tax=Carboxylicivirga fragile TaxID=3417571 RepID=UPI003D34C61C|nr:ATP-binding protein [Marinilabiliaceae bacterium N1Y90]